MKFLLVIMVLMFAMPIHADATVELTAYITDFLSRKIGKKSVPLYPKRLRASLSYIPTIIAECGEDIDPLLIAIIVSRESSWRAGIPGHLGEHGLMQIMPRYAKGYRLDDPLEQIRAGIDHFREALEMCNWNVKDAMNAYGCGQCKPHYKFLKRRWRYYQRMKKRYRNGNLRKTTINTK
jgi:soluble lytic murein transglycosylase-like protein